MAEDEDWDDEKRADAEARDKQSAEEEENRAEEEQSVARAEDQWKLSHLANTRFADLEGEGDDYFVKAYTGAPIFQPFEAAVAEVQSVEFLCHTLRSRGLEFILADKYATAGLKKALLAHNFDVIRAVKNCRMPRDTGGRPAKAKK